MGYYHTRHRSLRESFSGQRHLRDQLTLTLWKTDSDPHRVAVTHGVDYRTAAHIQDQILAAPETLHMQVDDDVASITGAICADTGALMEDVRPIVMLVLLRWYADDALLTDAAYTKIRGMAAKIVDNLQERQKQAEEAD